MPKPPREKNLRKIHAAKLGIARARALGHRLGRPVTLSPYMLEEIRRLRVEKGLSFRQIAKETGVATTVVFSNYKIVEERGLPDAISEAKKNAEFAAEFAAKGGFDDPEWEDEGEAEEDEDD